MRMFKEFTHSPLINGAAKVALTGLLFSFCQSGWAGECRMGDGYGGTTKLVNSEYSGATIRLPDQGAYINEIFTVNLTPGIQINCSPVKGNDGYNLMAQTNPELLAGSKYNEGMFATNIPGIYYSVKVKTSDTGIGGLFGTNTTGWYTTAAWGPNTPLDGKWLNTYIFLYVGYDYQGNPNRETVIKPRAGTLGKMSIGDPADSNNQPWTFTVDENSFQIPVVLPTCDIVMLGNGTHTVDLGDYFVSDIRYKRVKDVPFSINFNDCTSVARYTTKLTTTKLTGIDHDLLGNTLSTGAQGAGVKILYNNGNSQLIPNDANSSYDMTETGVPTSTQINFVAQLIADGSMITPGAFSASGVFTISYN